MGLLDQLNEVLLQTPRKYWGDKATRLGSLLSDSALTGAQAYGSANSPMAPEHSQTLAGLLADFTPVVGDVKSAYDGMNAAREGDYLGAALGGLGALPLVPSLAGMVKGSDILKMFPEFGGTKAATASGEPLLLHHGTTRQEPIQEFNRRFKPDVMKGKDSIDSIGTWFTSNPARVTDYGTADYPSFANLQNPRVFNSFDELRDEWKAIQSEGRRDKAYRERMKLHSQNPHWGNSDEFVQEMRFDGHDGVIVKKHGTGEWADQDAYIVFDPRNIKSAISP